MARFLGRCSVVAGVIEAPGRFRVGSHVLACDGGEAGTRKVLVVRPERVEIAPLEENQSPAPAGGLPGRIAAITYLGGQTDWHVDTEAGRILATRATPANSDPLSRLATGDAVILRWAAGFGRLLDHEEPQGEHA